MPAHVAATSSSLHTAPQRHAGLAEHNSRLAQASALGYRASLPSKLRCRHPIYSHRLPCACEAGQSARRRDGRDHSKLGVRHQSSSPAAAAPRLRAPPPPPTHLPSCPPKLDLRQQRSHGQAWRRRQAWGWRGAGGGSVRRDDDWAGQGRSLRLQRQGRWRRHQGRRRRCASVVVPAHRAASLFFPLLLGSSQCWPCPAASPPLPAGSRNKPGTDLTFVRHVPKFLQVRPCAFCWLLDACLMPAAASSGSAAAGLAAPARLL